MSKLVTQEERIARAWDPVGWAWYDQAVANHPARPTFHLDQMRRAKAVIEALGKSLMFEITGRALVDVGLNGAEIVHPDGRREPFKGFVVDPGKTMLECAMASLPPGAKLAVPSDEDRRRWQAQADHGDLGR